MLALKELRRLRAQRWGRVGRSKLQSEEEALRFIDSVGFCLLFRCEGIELPDLTSVTAGGWEEQFERVWSWRDSLSAAKKVFYGKLFRRRAGFISLGMFPSFYALSENYGEADDYLHDCAEGKMGAVARRIYEYVARHGPVASLALREALGLHGQQERYGFQKAILELQEQFRIVKVGTAREGGGEWASDLWELVVRWMPPELIAEGTRMPRKEAMRNIVVQYLRNCVAAREEDISSLFGWDGAETAAAVRGAAEEGVVVTGVEVERLGGKAVMLREDAALLGMCQGEGRP